MQLVHGGDKLKCADTTWIPVGEEDVDFLFTALASHIPCSIVNVLGIGVAEIFLRTNGADDGFLLQVDDVDGAGLFVGTIETRSEGIIAPEIQITNGAADGKAEG